MLNFGFRATTRRRDEKNNVAPLRETYNLSVYATYFKIRNSYFKKMRIDIILIAGILVSFSACQSQTPTPPVMQTPAKELAGDMAFQIDGEIRGIWQDSKGNMWFASNGNGVFKYDGKVLANYSEKHGLASNYVWEVEEGTDGKMWFKTYLRSKGEGIAMCRFDGQTFEVVEPCAEVMSNGFQGGFFLCEQYFDGQNMSKVQIPKTSPNKEAANGSYGYDIYASCLDRNGNVWFGTCVAGLCRYDGKTYTWFADKEMCAPIRDIFEDRDGTLWVGNNGGGLFRYDGKGFVNFSKEHNVHNPDFLTNLAGKPGMMARIWKIAQDKKGNLWIATIDNGIWRYDGKSLTNYTTKDGLGTNSIWTIYVDKNDKLWVGTGDAGVYVFDGKGFERF